MSPAFAVALPILRGVLDNDARSRVAGIARGVCDTSEIEHSIRRFSDRARWFHVLHALVVLSDHGVCCVVEWVAAHAGLLPLIILSTVRMASASAKSRPK